MLYFSKTNLSFYDDEIFPVGNLPKDAVVIAQAQHDAVFAAHATGQVIAADKNGMPTTTAPTPPTPAQAGRAGYDAAILAGVNIASASTPSLNGVYGITVADEANIAGTEAAVAANVFRGYYRQLNGTKVTMTGAQFTSIATAIYNYVNDLDNALDAAVSGGEWVAPPNSVSIP